MTGRETLLTTRASVASWLRDLQERITSGLEAADGTGRFREDVWERPGGGGGRSRILEQGTIIEKGGVNFSAVFGKAPDFLLQQTGPAAEPEFFATGVSIVLHPHSPMVPIIHMNVRYFDMGPEVQWVGGGIDLTPHYVKPEDARFFHQALKETCDRFDPDYYPVFKRWADDYFFIRHRKETRGIGGIFFDHLKADETHSFPERLEFMKAVGQTFLPTYQELMKRNAATGYSEAEKRWQLLRRGRYAEFNLVYDRGTKFGLETDGRIESILMSLPPLASWIYDFRPETGSPEAETQAVLVKGIDWLAS
jgi:coproporphyrinogen III oxidase